MDLILNMVTSYLVGIHSLDPFNVLQLDVGGISSPSTDGSCQHFDSAMLELAIGDLTQQTAVVTSVQGGDMLCEASPCSPSPCRNGGECVLNEDVVGGFECTCRQGFTGVDCTQDVAECDQGEFGSDPLAVYLGPLVPAYAKNCTYLHKWTCCFLV